MFDPQHALLYSPLIRRVYDEAPGYEAGAIAYWSGVLNFHFRQEDNFLVSPEQYVHRNNMTNGKQQMDTWVECYNDENNVRIGVMLHEAKREAQSIPGLEDQALKYAKGVLEDRGLVRVFVLTTTGTQFRTWYLDDGKKSMKAMFDGKAGSRSSYLDAGGKAGRTSQYLDNDSWIASERFYDFVREVKSSAMLFKAPTVPSQADSAHNPERAFRVRPKLIKDGIVQFEYPLPDGTEKIVKTRLENFQHDERFGCLAWFSNDYQQWFVADDIEGLQ